MQSWGLCTFAPFPRRNPRNPLHVQSSKRFYFNFFFLQNGWKSCAPVDGAEKAAMDAGGAWPADRGRGHHVSTWVCRSRGCCRSAAGLSHSRAGLPKQALGLSANFLHAASCSQEAQSLCLDLLFQENISCCFLTAL